MFHIILDIYIPEGGFFRLTDFSFYLLNQYDWPKMTYTEYLLHRFRCVIFLFEIFFTGHTRNVCQIMVEDADGLDNIKGKVAKRTEEIIFHAECEKSVQICFKSHELLVQQELKVFGRLPVLLPLFSGGYGGGISRLQEV